MPAWKALVVVVKGRLLLGTQGKAAAAKPAAKAEESSEEESDEEESDEDDDDTPAPAQVNPLPHLRPCLPTSWAVQKASQTPVIVSIFLVAAT